MSRICTVCDKRPRSGNNVSHSNRRTKRRFLPNIVKRNGIMLCTACLRTAKRGPRVRVKKIHTTPKPIPAAA